MAMAESEVETNTSAEPAKVGRPTKYKEEYNELVYKLCLLGHTDKDVARVLEVDELTVNRWKVDYPEFCKSLRSGKELADAEIASKLYHRAKGYSHPEDKIFQHNGEPVVVPTTKHYPPDTAAAIIWLKNRQPGRWRDKFDHELSGPGGAPIQVDMSAITTDELRRLAGVDEDTLELQQGEDGSWASGDGEPEA